MVTDMQLKHDYESSILLYCFEGMIVMDQISHYTSFFVLDLSISVVEYF